MASRIRVITRRLTGSTRLRTAPKSETLAVDKPTARIKPVDVGADFLIRANILRVPDVAHQTRVYRVEIEG